MKYSHHSHSSVLKDGLFPQYDEIKSKYDFYFQFQVYMKKKVACLEKDEL